MIVPLSERRAYGVLVELCEYLGHRAFEVNLHHFALAFVAEFFGNEFAGEFIELLHPDAVAVDFSFYVAVSRAAYAHAYGARCAVTRHTDHADIVSEIFAAELRAETDALSGLEQFLLKLHIAESAAEFIAGCWQ